MKKNADSIVLKNKLIRHIVLGAPHGFTDEVRDVIKNILCEAYGDYIIVQLCAEEDVFKEDIPLIGEECSDVFYLVYSNDNGNWDCRYRGIEYPEAVGTCI